MLNLHRQVEADLKKKVQTLEKAKPKDEINYEYIKNIFTKFLFFTTKNSINEAKQMEILLYDLLHYTKQEKEELDKIRNPKNERGFFSGLISKALGNSSEPESVPGITGNYIPSQNSRRAVSVQRGIRKAGTETSFYKDTPGDFSGISSNSISLKNQKALQKK